jgi:hypothetical protein
MSLAQFEIVRTVAWCDMDQPRSLIGLDKARRQQWNVELVALAGERMVRDGSRECGTGKTGEHRISLDTGASGKFVSK